MKIFIIDDDPLSVFLTENMLILEDGTHEITTFLSGKEALEALYTANEAAIPEWIFVDLNMPIMDGWGFLDALAPIAHLLCKTCSIYVLTSSINIADAHRIKEYPFVSGLIQKPIRSEDILSVS